MHLMWLSDVQTVEVHIVPERDKLKKGLVTPKLFEKKSSNLVEALAALTTLTFTITGAAKLNSGGLDTSEESRETIIAANEDCDACPEDVLQCVLLSENHTEYWADVCSTFTETDDE